MLLKDLTRHILLVVLLCSTSILDAQSAEKIKKQTLDSVQKCTSNAYEIINHHEADFVKKYMTHNGVSYLKKDFISGLGTTVHECLHGYDNDLSNGIGWDENSYPIAYFIDKNIVITFQGKRLFKTDQLHNNFFPKKVKELFRYGTYVYDKGPAETSSNQWGIYGLMEEFNAYYHDMQAQIEYYNCNYKGTKIEIIFGNEMNAYYEFNIFMGYYLQYAKKYEKQDYDVMMSNEKLRLAYSLMEINWRQLLTEVFQDKDLGLRLPNLSEDAKLYNSDLRSTMNEFMLSPEELQEYSDFTNKRTISMSAVEENLRWAGSDEVFTLFDYDIGGIEWTEDFTETNIEMDIDLKDPDSFYVTVLATDNHEEIMKMLMNESFTSYDYAGMFADEKGRLHIYLEKFKNKKEAYRLYQEIKSVFPKAKVE